MNIVNVGYDATNYYVLGPSKALLLVDIGWPGTLPKLLGTLKRKDLRLHDIHYLLITHYHPDHAGLAQEVKNQGVRLIVLEPQVEAIPQLKRYMKPSQGYIDITLKDTLQLNLNDSGAFLKRIGIQGSIIHTPGHSDDSVTLVLDNGAAFTGDLPPPGLVDAPGVEAVSQSWQLIRGLKATTIYPGHGPARPVPSITDMSSV